jgi:putative hydrolase of the HAD superfamily
MSDNEQPKVIFLDAVGTLFGVKGSVGEAYSAIAQKFAVKVAPDLLDAAFIESFKASHPLAFPGVALAKIPELEYQWWKAIAKTTFASAGVLDRFSDFGAFFRQLYVYFATAAPWYVYPDVVPALQHWQQQGIELGIISNFDSRITISTEIGAAKPDKAIFIAALKKHNCSPQEAWHIGDSLKEDYRGARAAGLQAFSLERPC